MDFSYALDIAYGIGGDNIIATAYYSQKNTDNKTKDNIKMFKKLGGKQIMFGIDATALKLNKTKKFDKILFGFPRNAVAPDSQSHNILFIKRVFEQVGQYLTDNGQFQLLFHINKSGHSPLEQWKIDYPDWNRIHDQIFTQNEMMKMYPFYQSRDGKNNKWIPNRTQLCVFQRS